MATLKDAIARGYHRANTQYLKLFPFIVRRYDRFQAYRKRKQEAREAREKELKEKQALKALYPLGHPPTAEDTLAAQRAMKVAHSHIDDYFDVTEKYGKLEHFTAAAQMPHLNKAAKSIEKARGIDPSATVTTETKDGTPIHWTLDSLSAHVLFLESISYHQQMMNDNAVYLDSYARKLQRKRQDAASYKALEAAQKALTYQPKSPFFLTHLASMAIHSGNKHIARDAIKQALAIDPDDLDALKLQDQLA